MRDAYKILRLGQRLAAGDWVADINVSDDFTDERVDAVRDLLWGSILNQHHHFTQK